MRELLYIGLMSGTSVDSIDAALIACQEHADETNGIRLLATHSAAISSVIRQQILALCREGPNEIEQVGALDRQLGELFANACQQLLAEAGLTPGEVCAIGSHGQTIRHRPPDQGRSSAQAFSWQIGDPNTISELTGITTVADFRRRDIAAGGQGAPLVPRFHQAAFGCNGCNRAIINIGGMANVTLLQGLQLTAGYDTGPGNVLLDAWIGEILNKPYDQDGQWAKSGIVDSELLRAALAHPFLGRPPPKSTGREDFNLDWLQQLIANHPNDSLEPANIQATILELTAQSISDCLHHATIPPDDVFLCGGGAMNGRLRTRLAELLDTIPLHTTTQLGIAPEWVEACAFAWLAKQTLNEATGNAPTVTGARSERILGGIYPA